MAEGESDRRLFFLRPILQGPILPFAPARAYMKDIQPAPMRVTSGRKEAACLLSRYS
jgi:hypothetical protein